MKIQNLLYYVWAILLLSGCAGYHQADSKNEKLPLIYPDYAGVTFPVNIAPPNFEIREAGEAFQTEIGCEGGQTEILIQSDAPVVCIPAGKWKALLQKAAGGNLFFRITVKQHDKWVRYADIRDSVSVHEIDPFLVYRLLYPGYELWNEMGIYQRDLTTYEQTPIVENRDIGKQCINCHTFHQNSPETMMMHIRGKQGGTLIYRNGKVEKVSPRLEGYKHGATYPAWHPSGKYIAFSANEIQQFFHSSGQKPIEVADMAADLMVYDVENRKAFTDSLVCGNRYMETFPAWTPDGKMLYFCRAAGYRKGMSLDSIRYDLYRIHFDGKQHKLHTLECVYEASACHKSVSFPRISPDGRFLMFTQSDYGNFSIWHSESDLYLLDLVTGDIRNITEVNSDNVDSFHTWSSTGRWFVFSSKRLDGLWARPYFAAFDPETGRFGKPFLLPQQDPVFYDTFTYTYNLPELIKSPIKNDFRER
ncbi:cytochrome C biosynthesis protein [uncultured Bacteroides sp.]|uniref:TolB family protein n=1 Tax=uncultured Bacteroides sp. TaxID=162156 RepID=UPI0025F87F54|nr:cytochrome C biosynthesis protein [uncultured Bacteroides sp.]